MKRTYKYISREKKKSKFGKSYWKYKYSKNETKQRPINKIKKKIKSKKFRNNEVCGISCEKIVCNFFKIDFKSCVNRINNNFINKNQEILNNHFKDIFKGFRGIKHIGNENKSTDFLMEKNHEYSPSLNNGIFGF